MWIRNKQPSMMTTSKSIESSHFLHSRNLFPYTYVQCTLSFNYGFFFNSLHDFCCSMCHILSLLVKYIRARLTQTFTFHCSFNQKMQNSFSNTCKNRYSSFLGQQDASTVYKMLIILGIICVRQTNIRDTVLRYYYCRCEKL